MDATSPAPVVLAIDLDELTLGHLAAATRGTELTVHAVTADEALAFAADGPILALFEWRGACSAEQTQLCAALRRAAPRGQCYLVAIGGASDPTLARAADGVVNDVLRRPFGGEVLVRLWQGLDTLESQRTTPSAREALVEALDNRWSGDLVVRSRGVVGHIHVQDGFVVWANVSSAPASMDEVLRHADIVLGAQVLAEVKQECRVSRVHFVDVLGAWGLVDAARGREAVRAFVDDRVERVLDLRDATVILLPMTRKHTEHLRFGAAELSSIGGPVEPAPASGPHVSTIRPAPYADITGAFQRSAQIDGVVSVAVLDRTTGESVLQSGAPIDADVAWAQLGTFTALGPQADEVIGVVGDRCYVLRSLPMAPELALLAVVSLRASSVGLARSLVARAVITPRPAAESEPCPISVRDDRGARHLVSAE